MSQINKRWVVARIGTGAIHEDDFKMEETIMRPVSDGEVRIRVVYASCDPTQIGWSREDTYLPAVPIGETMRAGGVGVVEFSKNKKFKVGDHVNGLFGFSEYWQGTPDARLSILPPIVPLDAAMCVFNHIGTASCPLDSMVHA
ncbi:hypothetical protein CYMTET_27429 [Cymbomonas tetramitiformis]|uniref:Oxidoreductase N-terminal domain-containing protein n=1 Tax=Cymbomonas tetramitiformis TaxID=36881 RepID=A0AAE0FQ94_9CHLO|nr:hypothetical protein CYMTET_27429 [Cymbomonas tetramitiformis]